MELILRYAIKYPYQQISINRKGKYLTNPTSKFVQLNLMSSSIYMYVKNLYHTIECLFLAKLFEPSTCGIICLLLLIAFLYTSSTKVKIKNLYQSHSYIHNKIYKQNTILLPYTFHIHKYLSNQSFDHKKHLLDNLLPHFVPLFGLFHSVCF